VASGFDGLLTPRGEGALAVFRVVGAEATARALAAFRPRGARPVRAPDLRVGRLDLGDGLTEDAVVRVDGVGAAAFAEFAVHGGLWACRRIEERFAARGIPAAPVPPAPFPVAAAARAAAWTDAQALFFAAAPRAWPAAVSALRGRAAADLAARDGALARLLAAAPFGEALLDPPTVTLHGAPNAGKSTLFNAWLGESRALVAPEAGTTRDVVEERWSLEGFPFVLRDTAGLRDAEDPTEREGVRRARRAAAEAGIAVRVIDGARTLEAQDAADLLRGVVDGASGRARLVVVTRADAARRGPAACALLGAGTPFVAVDGVSGAGLVEAAAAVFAASPFASVPVDGVAPYHPAQAAAFLAAARAAAAGDDVGADAALAAAARAG